MGEKAFHRELETGQEKFLFYSKFLNGQLLVIKCFGFPPGIISCPDFFYTFSTTIKASLTNNISCVLISFYLYD